METNLNLWFETLATIASITVIISAFLIDRVFKITKNILKQVVTWIVAVLLTIAGNLLNIGFAAEFPWLTTLAYGVGAGLVANGVFDIATVQVILEFLKLKKTDKEKETENFDKMPPEWKERNLPKK